MAALPESLTFLAFSCGATIDSLTSDLVTCMRIQTMLGNRLSEAEAYSHRLESHASRFH